MVVKIVMEARFMETGRVNSWEVPPARVTASGGQWRPNISLERIASAGVVPFGAAILDWDSVWP